MTAAAMPQAPVVYIAGAIACSTVTPTRLRSTGLHGSPSDSTVLKSSTLKMRAGEPRRYARGMPPASALVVPAWLMVTATLLAAPPLMGRAFRDNYRRRAAWTRPFGRGCMGLTMLIVVAKLASFSFRSPLANVAVGCAGIFAGSYIAFGAWYSANHLVRYAARGLMCLVFGMGYMTATVGFLGLMFIVSDYVAPPRSAQVVAPGLLCTITDWGNVFDSGYDVEIYRRWRQLPWLQREIAEDRVDLTFGDRASTCAKLLASIRR